MTARDYQVLLELEKDAETARKKAAEAAAPWREAALAIAMERSGMQVSRVYFKADKVRYICRGTGIYRDDEWDESFPVSLLFERLNVQS